MSSLSTEKRLSVFSHDGREFFLAEEIRIYFPIFMKMVRKDFGEKVYLD